MIAPTAARRDWLDRLRSKSPGYDESAAELAALYRARAARLDDAFPSAPGEAA